MRDPHDSFGKLHMKPILLKSTRGLSLIRCIPTHGETVRQKELCCFSLARAVFLGWLYGEHTNTTTSTALGGVLRKFTYGSANTGKGKT